MNKLIKNELTKIFKKKSIYITFILILLFMVFINGMNKYGESLISNMVSSRYTKEYLEKEIKNIEENNIQDQGYLTHLKAQLEVFKLKEKYNKDSWQVAVIDEKISMQLIELASMDSKEPGNAQTRQKLEEEYAENLKRLENDDWKSFAQADLSSIQNQLKEQKLAEQQMTDRTQKRSIEQNIKTLEIQEQVEKWRLEKSIGYGTDYFHQALNKYYSYHVNLIQLQSNGEETFSTKQQCQDLQAKIAEQKYSIETMRQTARNDDTRGMVMGFFSNYGLFIAIIVIMVAGSIVSEEFNKGTIKLLLVRPYKRTKILCAKFITVLIMLVISIVVMALAQTLIGGILFGWESLELPATIYHYETQTLETLSLVKYFGIQALCNLPMYLLLATLGFTISIAFNTTPIAIIIPLLGYMVSSIINQLAIGYNVNWLKYFVTLNWDLSTYIGGGLGLMEGLNMMFSSIVCAVYFIIMLIISFVIFKKRDIKNV